MSKKEEKSKKKEEDAKEEEEPNELSAPAVIDLEAILKPISDDNPSGEYTRYSGAYDEIGEARRADDTLEKGDWQGELKIADFQQVVDLAVPVLEKETKDIQIAAWLAEELVKQHGFVGLRDALKLLSGLQENFWDTLFPEIDEGDMEGRANALAWMAKKAAFAIKQVVITQGEGHDYFDWEDSGRFKFPEDIDSLPAAEQAGAKALKAQAEKENRVTADRWAKAIALSKRAFYEELNVAIEECWVEYKEINRVIEEKFDPKQAPGLTELKKALDKVQTQTGKLLKMKRIEEPDPVEEEEVDSEEAATGNGAKGAVNSKSGAIRNRRDALKKLSELASFFRKTEPHSPVSYLVNRAIKWGNMPLDSWLQDVIKDQNILSQIRQTLGFNTEGAAEPINTPDASPNPGETSDSSTTGGSSAPSGGFAPMQ